ncbi:MAG TPA: asparagine synthase-related protein [Acidimicrobiales bacterium]|nr:asparagine synthase-related protein [Acidimicrobiales bacterium]
MTFLASVAAGAASADSLRARAARAATGEIALTRHADLVVAWAVKSPWVQTHDDGDVLVVLDGRLHNLSPGPMGQAEAVLRRYRARGVNVARGLLGDFVVVVLDRKASALLVARDPVGVRPWYQASSGGHHAGASDVATLASLPWVDTAVNEHIAIEYLAAVPESRGETLYRGIRTLRPGKTWLLDAGRATTFSHHRWEVEPELEISWEDAARRCREVLDEAVRCRLELSGPPTSELSGGLDSSTVVGTAVLLGRGDLTVARLFFDDPRADERVYSDAVIDHWGLRAVSEPPWVPSPEEWWELTRQLRRPPPDPNFTMFANLHRALLADGRPDGLTGLGGDDAFIAVGTGPRVVSAAKLRQRRVLAELARWSTRNLRRSWPQLVKPTLGYLAAPWRRGRHPSWVTGAAAARAGLGQLVHRRAEPVTGVDAIDQRLAPLTSGYDAWVLEDRAVVADWVGRRDSHPFLDPRFITATYGLDPWWPTRGGHERALEVAAFGDRLPPTVARRRSKAEFSEVFWPQVLDRNTLAEVRTGPLRDLGWLDAGGFDRLVTNAKEGMANAAIPLSRCVSLDHWMRTQ